MQAIDMRLVDLVQIYGEELPRMGGIKLLQTIRELDCASIIVSKDQQVLGGCTFRVHSLMTLPVENSTDLNQSSIMIELLLLGVKKAQQKAGLGSTLLEALK